MSEPSASDDAVPPGETLLETIEHLGMSQAELAARTGRPLKTINEIIKGKCAITYETALQLEKAVNIPARFWVAREMDYRKEFYKIEEEKQLLTHLDWLKNFPITEMIKKGW